jgi:outer membrane lipoprotein
MRFLHATSLVLLALAAACARPPAQLAGTFAEITVSQAQQGAGDGTRVRWGGKIVSVGVEDRETCFDVVSRPLDRWARPRETDETEGRFLACAPGFWDPAVYEKDRAVTFVGVLAPPELRKIGDYEYPYPVLRAETVHLWPKRPDREIVYYDPWFSPWPGPVFGVWPYYGYYGFYR